MINSMNITIETIATRAGSGSSVGGLILNSHVYVEPLE